MIGTAKRASLAFLCLVLLATLAWRSFLIADETRFVLVTSFGRPVALYNDEAGEAGPHPKWPWQVARGVDRRRRHFDLAAREVMTGDKKNLDVSALVAWRVGDPARFVRAAGDAEAVEARLDDRVAAALSDAFGRRDLAVVASTDDGAWDLDGLLAEVLGRVAGPAREELGVEVVDVRLRRFAPPLEVRPAVFDLIRAERQQVAARLRAEGEARHRAITSEADREAEAMLAEADAEARRIVAEGEAEATRLLNEAHALDPRFAEFLRTLEAYRALLDGRATVVLDPESPLLRLLHRGPPAELLTPGEPSTAPLAVDEGVRTGEAPGGDE